MKVFIHQVTLITSHKFTSSSVDENNDLSSKEFKNKELGNFHSDTVFSQVTVFELR